MKHIYIILFSFLILNKLSAQNSKLVDRLSIEQNLNKEKLVLSIMDFLNKGITGNYNSNMYLINAMQSNFRYKDSSLYWGEMDNELPNGYGIKYKKGKSLRIGKFVDSVLDGVSLHFNYPDRLYFGNITSNAYNEEGYLYFLRDTLHFDEYVQNIFSGNFNKLFENNNISTKYAGTFSNMHKSITEQTFEGVEEIFIPDSANMLLNKQIITYTGKQVEQKLIGKVKVDFSMNDKKGNTVQKWYYTGKWINKKPSGEGELIISTITENQVIKYQGTFIGMDSVIGDLIINADTIQGRLPVDKPFNGYGKIKNTNFVYEGNILNYNPSGKGKMMFPNASYYEGTFQNGEAAMGEFYNSTTQEKIVGNFKNGLPDGKVKVILNGKTTFATYIDGVRK
jgi:hypothetical protein